MEKWNALPIKGRNYYPCQQPLTDIEFVQKHTQLSWKTLFVILSKRDPIFDNGMSIKLSFMNGLVTTDFYEFRMQPQFHIQGRQVRLTETFKHIGGEDGNMSGEGTVIYFNTGVVFKGIFVGEKHPFMMGPGKIIYPDGEIAECGWNTNIPSRPYPLYSGVKKCLEGNKCTKSCGGLPQMMYFHDGEQYCEHCETHCLKRKSISFWVMDPKLCACKCSS